MRDHGSSGSLAMGAGYGDGQVVIFHDLSQQLGPGKHRQSHFLSLLKLWIIRMDSGGIYYQIDIFCNVGGSLADIDLCPSGFQKLRQVRIFGIRT